MYSMWVSISELLARHEGPVLENASLTYADVTIVDLQAFLHDSYFAPAAVSTLTLKL